MLKIRSYYIDYLIIAIVVILGYWQISLYQFTIKCDAALLSLPWKKFVSDSLRSGYFPVWNPYINLGWTQGMEPSTWYYPSWVFALFGKYRLSHLHTEIILHFILGGIGMYKLLSLLKLDRWALLSGSLVYILSGFFVGNFQHLGWTFYGCWLPVVLFYFFSLIKDPRFTTALKLGLTGALLVMSSYIPFTVTTFIFLTLTVFFVLIRNIREKRNNETFTFLKFLFISILLLFIVCAPCFYMLYINIDTMYRGGKYDDQTAAFGSLVPTSWISFIWPFGTTAHGKNWGMTDISMNNVFIGWISFLLISFAFLEKEKRKIVRFLAVISLLAISFSFGKYFPPTFFVFRHLPFYEKLRFAAQFRIYFIIAASVLVAIGSNYILKNEKTKPIRIFLYISILIFLAIGITGNHAPFLKHFNAIIVQEKNDQSIWASVKFQSIIWAIIGIFMILWFTLGGNDHSKIVKRLIIFNILFVFLAAQMNMFYTGVANQPVSEINKQWLQLPEKFGCIANKTMKEYNTVPVGLTWQNTSTLFHMPCADNYHPYDSKNYADYSRSGHREFSLVYGTIINYKGEYANILTWGINGTDSILFTPYEMIFTTRDTLFDELRIQVSKTPSTKLTMNGSPTEIEMQDAAMMIKNVEPNSKILISFIPPYIKFFAFMGIISFLTILLFLCIHRLLRKNEPQ